MCDAVDFGIIHRHTMSVKTKQEHLGCGVWRGHDGVGALRRAPSSVLSVLCARGWPFELLRRFRNE